MNLLTPGELAPDFEIDDLHGARVRLSDLRGQPVLLYFLRGFM
jgi:peroxiredoxin Q/BCP